MKKGGQDLTVRCFFTKEGKMPQELILQSLQLFIESNFQNGTILMGNGCLSQEA